MIKGMIFDLYREGLETVRVMSLGEHSALCLEGNVGEIIHNIDYDKEVGEIIILNILDPEL